MLVISRKAKDYFNIVVLHILGDFIRNITEIKKKDKSVKNIISVRTGFMRTWSWNFNIIGNWKCFCSGICFYVEPFCMLNFFVSYLAIPRTILGHWRGGKIILPMIMTAVLVWPKGSWEARWKVVSKSVDNLISGTWTRIPAN